MDFLKHTNALRRTVFVLAMLCLLSFSRAALAAAPVDTENAPLQLYEQKIKAGLVYNLLKYTVWSVFSGATKPTLKVCLYGDDIFDGYLAPLEGRTAQQAVIAIKHVNLVKEVGNCQAVIIHNSQAKNLTEILQFIEGKQILTISDIHQFSRLGGMVELAKEGEKVSLYINKSAVTHAGLTIDGSMLRLAKIVGK